VNTAVRGSCRHDAAVAAAAKPSVRAQVGINIHSLRYRALALIREVGFREVEAGDLYGRSPAEFTGLLKTAGLRAMSIGASWDALWKEIDGVATHAGRWEPSTWFAPQSPIARSIWQWRIASPRRTI